MNGVIETLKSIDSNNEAYHLYPRTLVEAITNRNGESLEGLLQNAGGASTAAEVSYDDAAIESLPMGTDNVQDTLDRFKEGFVGMAKSFQEMGEALNEIPTNMQSYTDEKATETLTEAKAYTDTAISNLDVSNAPTNLTATNIAYDDTVNPVEETGAETVQEALDMYKSAFVKVEQEFEEIFQVFEGFGDALNEELTSAMGEAKTYTDNEISNHSHQFMLISSDVLETGWYIIGRGQGAHSCNINIMEMSITDESTPPCVIMANILSNEYGGQVGSVKVQDYTTYEGCPSYVGFDKVALVELSGGKTALAIHYTNPGCVEHNCIITVTSLFGGIMTLGDMSMNMSFQPYDGSTLTYLGAELDEDKQLSPIREFELKEQPNLADILARLEVLEAQGVSDVLDPEGVEF